MHHMQGSQAIRVSASSLESAAPSAGDHLLHPHGQAGCVTWSGRWLKHQNQSKCDKRAEGEAAAERQGRLRSVG